MLAELVIEVTLEPYDTATRGAVVERSPLRRRHSLRGYELDRLRRTVANGGDLGALYPAVPPLGNKEETPYGGFNPTEMPSAGGPPVACVIITDSTTVHGAEVGDRVSEFQRLADWKTLKGVPSVVRTVGWITGNYEWTSPRDRIREFVKDAYSKWGTDYVILGGDIEVVPESRVEANSNHPTDAYYGYLDGSGLTTDDSFWDVWEGGMPSFRQLTVDPVVVWPSCGGAPADTVALIEDCQFYDNEAVNRGAALVQFAVVTGTTFDLNRAGFSRGGLLAFSSRVDHCRFRENAAVLAGGLQVVDCAVVGSLFADNSAVQRGGGIDCDGYTTVLRSCLLTNNSAAYGGGISAFRSQASVIGCTIAGNEAEVGSGLYMSDFEPVTWPVGNTIVFGGRKGEAIRREGLVTVVASCLDVFGNAGGDWVGCIGDQNGERGNFTADPRFCKSDAFTLAENSPCLPGNHPHGVECGLIGAFGVGCPPVPVEDATWGAIKARYRE